MARHMGVSAVTFRQALEKLREAGLVSTRPGRGGGTFINAPLEVLERLAREALVETSLSKIADLARAVSELHASSARMAAQGRDENDIAELRMSVQRLLEPMTAVERRRAWTMYAITIARIARSETLLNALVPLIGELQLLAWMDEKSRLNSELKKAALQTVNAIDQAAPEDASEAARLQIELITREIIRERSHLFIQNAQSKDQSPKEAFHDLLVYVHQIQKSLELAQLQLANIKAPQHARGGQAEKVDKIVKEIASKNRTLLRGAGLAYAPDMLEDTRLWIDWWDTNDGINLMFKSHDFDSQSLQYYDYEHMQWFTQPLQSNSFSIVGPYLDRGGIETSTITVSIPITSGAFTGCVLGADLHVPGIEETLLKSSRSVAKDHILINEEKRVLVSTSPAILHSSLLNSGQASVLKVVAEEEGDPFTGWKLLCVPENIKV